MANAIMSALNMSAIEEQVKTREQALKQAQEALNVQKVFLDETNKLMNGKGKVLADKYNGVCKKITKIDNDLTALKTKRKTLVEEASTVIETIRIQYPVVAEQMKKIPTVKVNGGKRNPVKDPQTGKVYDCGADACRAFDIDIRGDSAMRRWKAEKGYDLVTVDKTEEVVKTEEVDKTEEVVKVNKTEEVVKVKKGK